MRVPVAVARVIRAWSPDIGLKSGEINLLLLFFQDSFCAEASRARLEIRDFSEKVVFDGVFGDFVENVQAK